MPKKLAVLAAVLAAVLSMTTPALAQDEFPTCEIQDACLDTPEEQQIANGEEDIPSVSGIGCEGLPADQEMSNPIQDPECDEVDQSLEDFPGSNGSQKVNSAGNLQSASAAQYGISPACATCAQDVLTAAKEAITKGGSDGGTSPEETFGAALDAARDTGGTREAAASEEAGTPVEDTAAYQAAFEAAKEAGADDETAREAAEQAVADLRSDVATSSADRSATSKANKASKVRKGGGTTAAEGKKDRKDRASRSDDGKGEDRKDKARKGKASNDGASEEETTNEEVVTSGDNSGAGGGDTPSTSTGSGAPLLLGGVALLSVGGYAGLRLARSWSSTDVVRRLLRN
ncbi:MAG: hypothetical protein AVDCRST_MAG28-862 [uncultured Rubrobacteraceae bacterium]|uniref:Uncharacterized protein n=1 Tax=uncultured Rubrobacteraceae bacterium TaxID=349277 RepID=A0A6J4QKG5_9ACTN|nr:MAG: hypothetical protein AVDCRST_MAG28-862 [uncultured Rubrobacteraceae bacterium]